MSYELTKEKIETMLDRIVKEEYGGCHPYYDNPCVLQIRIKDRAIEVFCVGKWRALRYYTRLNTIPSKKIMAQVERSLRLNTGDTFKNKTIQWKWVS